MNLKEKRKFYEKVYFFELDKRENIYTKLRLPIAILTFIGSFNLFLITETIPSISEKFIILSVSNVFMVSSSFILIYLGYCIYNVLTDWTYHEVSPKDFDEHYDKLIRYYQKDSGEEQDEQKSELIVREPFEKDLTRQLMECANYNHNINIERNAYIVRFIEVLPLYLVVLALFYASLFIY